MELGVQSVHEHSLVWMNRGHDFPCFIRALEELREKYSGMCAHYSQAALRKQVGNDGAALTMA